MLTFNERAGAEFTARFFDQANAPAVPGTVHYRLDGPTDSLLDWTELTPIVVQDGTGIREVSALIEIPGSLHAITTNQRRELRALLVVANKDTDREYSQELEYNIRNVRGRT